MDEIPGYFLYEAGPGGLDYELLQRMDIANPGVYELRLSAHSGARNTDELARTRRVAGRARCHGCPPCMWWSVLGDRRAALPDADGGGECEGGGRHQHRGEGGELRHAQRRRFAQRSADEQVAQQ